MVATEKPLMALCAADIMSRNVVMIPREMSLQCAARMLARAGVTGAPVVDANGRCIGVLSATDFMNWMKEGHEPSQPKEAEDCMCKPWQIREDAAEMESCVETCMTKDPVLAFANVKVGELAAMMLDAHVHRIIVVEAVSQTPIGVVSSFDIIAAVARSHQTHLDELHSPYDTSGETVH